MQDHIQAVGIAWFEEDDYHAFRLLLPDRDWHDTFREWETAAQQYIQRLRDQGVRAVKAQVRSSAFAAWCRSTGLNIDTKALQHFANLAAIRSSTGEH